MRTERTSSLTPPSSMSRDSQRQSGPGPSRLPSSPGGLTARRSANVETPPPGSDLLELLPPELRLKVVTRLPADDLAKLAAASTSLRNEVAPLRAPSMRLTKVVHSVVTANRRGVNEWSTRGFRRRSNPHQALAALGEALGHEPLTDVAAASVNELSASEFAVLKDFVGKISSLCTHNKIDRDPQLHAIALARALVSRFKARINEHPLNELAVAVAELCKSVPALKHDHALSTEAFRAARIVVRHAREETAESIFWATVNTFGILPVIAAFSGLMSVPALTLRGMFKQDKTSSLALKFLVDVITEIPRGQISDQLHIQVRDLLVGITDETAKKIDRLIAILNYKSTPEQRADLRTTLLAADRRALASKILA